MKAAHPFPSYLGSMDRHERLCFIGLSGMDCLRPVEKLVLTEMLGASRVLALSLADLSRMVGRRLLTRTWDADAILASAARAEEALTAGGIDTIFYGDGSYPPQLREIYDPPVMLYVRGALSDPACAMAGIVGTRFPSGAARKAAFRLGFECGREGIGVVSGLARGIDREAHEGCTAAGGCSVAVLGSGIDQVYPASSRTAAMALLERGGAIVSEYPPGTPPLRHHFPARNRIISGLSRAVVVVEAPASSGALITADYALEQGRDMYVHAEGIHGTAGAGTQKLADQGAPVIHGVSDILGEWGRKPRPRAAPPVAEDEPRGASAVLKKEFEGACVVHAGDIYWRT